MYHRLALVLILPLLFASCDLYVDLPLPGAGSDRKITLLGELTAGDTMFIRGGQSTPLKQGSVATLVEGLQVSVKDQGGAVTDLNGMADAYSADLYTIRFSNPTKVTAGNTYTMTARQSELGEAIVAINIPKPFSARFSGAARVGYKNDSAMRLDIDISDNEAASAYYAIEVISQTVNINIYFIYNGSEYSLLSDRLLYDSLKLAGVTVPERMDTLNVGLLTRQSIYSSDPLNDNAGGGAAREFRRIFFQGRSFGGRDHHTQVLIPRTYPYGLAGQFVQTIVYVKSVSADYYTFLKAYEQYNGSLDYGTNVTPTNLSGNVKGGFGMVGGVYRQQTTFLY